MDYEEMLYEFKSIQREYENKLYKGQSRQNILNEFITEGNYKLTQALEAHKGSTDSAENKKNADTLYKYYEFSIRHHIIND